MKLAFNKNIKSEEFLFFANISDLMNEIEKH